MNQALLLIEKHFAQSKDARYQLCVSSQLHRGVCEAFGVSVGRVARVHRLGENIIGGDGAHHGVAQVSRHLFCMLLAEY